MYKLNIPFSVNGVKELNNKLDLMKRKIPELSALFKKKSLDYIEERANIYIGNTTGGSAWYQVTGRLSRSWIKDYDIGTLINFCEYSAFVEYGTGIVGKGTHPDPNGYQYDVNNHGNTGWGFIDEDGNFHWTKGMQAHRYLFDAVQDYTVGEAYKKIYLDCFNEVMGGIFR